MIDLPGLDKLFEHAIGFVLKLRASARVLLVARRTQAKLNTPVLKVRGEAVR